MICCKCRQIKLLYLIYCQFFWKKKCWVHGNRVFPNNSWKYILGYVYISGSKTINRNLNYGSMLMCTSCKINDVRNIQLQLLPKFWKFKQNTSVIYHFIITCIYKIRGMVTWCSRPRVNFYSLNSARYNGFNIFLYLTMRSDKLPIKIDIGLKL